MLTFIFIFFKKFKFFNILFKTLVKFNFRTIVLSNYANKQSFAESNDIHIFIFLYF